MTNDDENNKNIESKNNDNNENNYVDITDTAKKENSKFHIIKKNVFKKTMSDLWNSSPLFKMFCLLVLVLFAWYLYIASGLHGFIIGVSIALIPFVIGIMIAILPHPLTIKLQKIVQNKSVMKKNKKNGKDVVSSRFTLKMAGIIVFFINMSLLIGLLYLIIPLIYNQFDGFLSTLMSEEFKERFEKFLNGIKINVSKEDINEWYNSIENLITRYVSRNGFGWFSTTSTVMISMLMGFAIGFYLIHDWKNYSEAVIDVIHPNKTKESKEKEKIIGKKIRKTLISWSKGFLLDQMFIFTLTGVLLYFLGVREWFILSLIMVILNTIPFIGPIIGGVIIVGFLFVNNVNNIPLEHMHGWYSIDSLAVIIIGTVGIFTIQTVESVWWIPKIYNKTLNIHPATILICLALAGIIISPFILPLVIPFIAVSKTIYKEKTGREVRL